MEPTLSQILWREPWSSRTQQDLERAFHSCALRLLPLGSQELSLSNGTIGGVALMEHVHLAPAGPRWTSLHLPSSKISAECLLAHLVARVGKPGLILTEFQHTAWGFTLLAPGGKRHEFMNLHGLEEAKLPPKQIDLTAIGEILEVPLESFSGYLKPQSQDVVSTKKIVPTDHFSLGDPWIRVDFLRALGIEYPTPGQCTHGRFLRWTPR